MSIRRAFAVLAGASLALTPLALVASPAQAQTASVTLVGSIQSELGCAADWDPACAATHLERIGDTTAYRKVFDVPAGSYSYKVAINDSWAENYGVGGAKNGGDLPLVLQGPARVEFSYDDATHAIGITPLTLSGSATRADATRATDSLRAPLTKERYYFVMADRFANGTKANDTGGLTGSKLQTGFDPADKGFYHGGDLRGVINKLDYIKGMGTTAIWLTPSFKNKPVQGGPGQESAGYHGYWITDFTQIDPHLGTNADMTELINRAHAKGMKVFFDIITNHTADVIDYSEKQYTYRDKATFPYKDASGAVFDDKDYAGGSTFPALDPATSFPYHPVFDSPTDATAKTPAWLNDRTMYHNRGDSTFAGESSEYGDFIGLDDLFTERPEVVRGMGEIYKKWVDFGIDGFRIDTVKHVNLEFWQQFIPTILGEAKARGNNDFFAFGEVYDARPEVMSTYTTRGKLQATLDFGFQQQGINWAQGKAGTDLRDFYAKDDWYTDTDSNAYQLPTFLGNHDMGRGAMFLQQASANDAQWMQRVKLANSLMFFTRGQPVTYYGDEQGFVGTGGDQLAREDMFASKVDVYNNEKMLGTTSGSRDRYDTTAPLYQHVKALSQLRERYPALADGAQIHRYASSGPGIYAFSRYDRATGIEYVVAANNATTNANATFATWSRGQTLRPIYGPSAQLATNKDGRVSVTLPPLSVSVWRASAPIVRPKAAPQVQFASPAPGAVVGERTEVRAAIPNDTFAQASFLYRPVGTSTWTPIGTDDNPPYRVFHDVSGIAKGTLLEYRVVVKDSAGHVSATSTYAVTGTPGPVASGGGGVGPVTQPSAVSVPGSHNSEMGCAADWAPDCSQAQLMLDPRDGIWKGSYTLPAGPYAYKAAINKSWDENYGAGGLPGGDNLSYTAADRPVTFYYDHATHWVTSDAQGPIITAPGTFQSKLGCGADWAPDCMKPWLQDPNGDGILTWSSDQIPAGSYEFKVAHNLTFAEAYGSGGSPTGANVALQVPSDGLVVTISYDIATHQISTSVRRAVAVPDLTKQRALWVTPDLVAWPKEMLPEGTDPAALRWTMAWSATGGLRVDAEAITGGSSARLTYEPKGFPKSVLAAHPEVADYVALRLDPALAAKARQFAGGPVAVAMHDDLGRIIDATGVKRAWR